MYAEATSVSVDWRKADVMWCEFLVLSMGEIMSYLVCVKRGCQGVWLDWLWPCCVCGCPTEPWPRPLPLCHSGIRGIGVGLWLGSERRSQSPCNTAKGKGIMHKWTHIHKLTIHIHNMMLLVNSTEKHEYPLNLPGPSLIQLTKNLDSQPSTRTNK